jgi:ankyrin repeat protein
VVGELLGAGADVNAKANDGRTVLMHAAQQHHMEVAWLLLGEGADFDHTWLAQRHYSAALLAVWSWGKRSALVALRNHLLA